MSDNPTSGVNQQERLNYSSNFSSFLAGFIEGEGSLCVSIKKKSTGKLSGYFLSPEFFLYQHLSGLEILRMAKEYFGAGDISPKPGNEKVMVYRIGSSNVLKTRVIPYFEEYVIPFSCKRETFYSFKRVLEMMEQGLHRTPQGFMNVLEIVYKMNPHSKGKKRKLTLDELKSRILRDYMPNGQSHNPVFD